MRLLKIEIKNIAKHEDTSLDINKPLTLLFGDVEQGKTTVLNAVRWGLGCTAPDNVIKEGCETASIHLVFDNATSTRSFYKAKDGSEVARPLEFVENGHLVKKPIEYLKTKVNPFLLDNEYFMKMGTVDQMKFFVSLFNIDTSAENKIITDTENQNKSLRIEIKTIGEVVPVEVIKPDVDALKDKKAKVDADNNSKRIIYDALETEYSDVEKLMADKACDHTDIEFEIARLVAKKKELEEYINANKDHIKPVEPKYTPTDAIEESISNAKADEIRYEQYLADTKKLELKNTKELELKTGEETLKKTKAAKIAKLESFSDNSGIDGLKFIEGGYTYHGTAFDMLATSKRQDLSNRLSALFPSDFDIDLIDRAESLGTKNLKNLAKLAVSGKRTIIATVVSDTMAIDDESIGVFSVSDGVVTEQSNG